MRTLEQIAQSVSMDIESFKNMLQLYKATPAFFGGDLAAALEEAKQLESVEVIPLTLDSIMKNIVKIEECLDGTDHALLHIDDILIRGLSQANAEQLEEHLIERLDNYDSINGYYFRDSRELLTWIKDNISID